MPRRDDIRKEAAAKAKLIAADGANPRCELDPVQLGDRDRHVLAVALAYALAGIEALETEVGYPLPPVEEKACRISFED